MNVMKLNVLEYFNAEVRLFKESADSQGQIECLFSHISLEKKCCS